MYNITVKTGKRTQMIDITEDIRKAVEKSSVESGICTVFVPHTTAAVTINENADADVTRDMLYEINKTVPFEDGYSHMEGNSAAHIKSSLFGASQQILIENRSLVLGTWQGVYFCEFDGPRNRKVFVSVCGNGG